jgi:hypothetical protein
MEFKSAEPARAAAAPAPAQAAAPTAYGQSRTLGANIDIRV